MATEKIIFTVVREGYIEQFDNRDTAKLVYKQMKEEHPETVLLKTVTKVEVLVYNEKIECWLPKYLTS